MTDTTTMDGMVKTHDLEWSFDRRVTTEHFGSQKYSTSTKALRELVANSFGAEATRVSITLQQNDMGGLDSITVSDDGHGIPMKTLRERFMVVGVSPDEASASASCLGRFGVGRLAVHRIGTSSRWTSVAISGADACTEVMFVLRSDDRQGLQVQERTVPRSTPCGTVIQIFNIRDKEIDRLTPAFIANDLLSHFCGYLLTNQSRTILIDDEPVAVASLVGTWQTETIPPIPAVPDNISLHHIILKRPIDQTRFAANVVFSAKGRTVHRHTVDDPPSPSYLAIIECPYLDSIVTSNRELLIRMDGGFNALKSSVLERVRIFGERLRGQRKRSFIEKARKESFYPYRAASTDPMVGVKKAVYDVVLEKVNETANIESMTKRHQELVFRLLKRSLDNENLLEVLSEIAKLSDDDIDKFRCLLERTTLDSIIKLSSEVTHRLDFVDVLHGLVYGNVAKHVKERSQLHRILEPECWIFGAQFHLAASDKSFREVIRRHRKLAGLDEIDEDMLANIQGVSDIPDLFLAATRDYPVQPKHHHVLVELKAPSVSLGRKEANQIRRYAETLLESHEFGETGSTCWDLFLISGKATKEIERDRNEKDRPVGCLHKWDNMMVWAFEWSEVLTRAREEMQLVRDHLRRKSEELTISDYLRMNFPDILADLTEKLAVVDA